MVRMVKKRLPRGLWRVRSWKCSEIKDLVQGSLLQHEYGFIPSNLPLPMGRCDRGSGSCRALGTALGSAVGPRICCVLRARLWRGASSGSGLVMVCDGN